MGAPQGIETCTQVSSGEMSTPSRLGAGQQFAISAYWFATNLLWGALLWIIIPSQMKRVAPTHPAEAIGLVLGVGAVPAVVAPLLIGPLSDRCMSRWGRRRPYMVAGVAVNLLGLAMVWLAGDVRSLWLYVVGYFVTNAGNNIATGSYSGVIPDIVPEAQRGEASGWMAAMSQLGTILGVFAAGLLMNAGQVAASFALIAVSLVAFLLITVLGVRERPRSQAPPPIDWLRFLRSLWVSPRRHPDFAWVWLTRAFVVMGLWTVQEYMQNYLTDVMGVPEDRKELVAGNVLGVALICATVTGLLAGALSDRVGRKRVVYVSNAVVALTCFGFIFAPSLPYVFAAAIIFGLGFGAYYSVDWALACDVLPDKQEAAAKDMAVWHIALTLPQSIALPLAGLLLAAFGKTMVHTAIGDVAHYTRAGYTAIFTLAACFLLLGAVLLRNVRGVR
jgi:MFS family permease